MSIIYLQLLQVLETTCYLERKVQDILHVKETLAVHIVTWGVRIRRKFHRETTVLGETATYSRTIPIQTGRSGGCTSLGRQANVWENRALLTEGNLFLQDWASRVQGGVVLSQADNPRDVVELVHSLFALMEIILQISMESKLHN